MAGEAKTPAFMFGAATVMIGAMADVLELTPAAHSIGLVKNFVMTNEQGVAELTQGVMNVPVFTQVNSVHTKATMEVYEYTAKNLSYALGLDGTSLTTLKNYALKTAITGDGTTTDEILITSDTDISSEFPVSGWLMLQASGAGEYDLVHLGKITAVAYATQTVTVTTAGHPIPTGVNFASGDVVARVNLVKVGSQILNPFLGAKIVGVLPDGSEALPIICPKIKITQGFNVSFRTDDYGNMPFEFTPYPLVSTDTMYSEFGGQGNAFLFKR